MTGDEFVLNPIKVSRKITRGELVCVRRAKTCRNPFLACQPPPGEYAQLSYLLLASTKIREIIPFTNNNGARERAMTYTLKPWGLYCLS